MSLEVPSSLVVNTQELNPADYEALLRVLGGMGVEAAEVFDPTRSTDLLAPEAMPTLRAFPEPTGDQSDYLLTKEDFTVCAEAYGFSKAVRGIDTRAVNALLRLTPIAKVELCSSGRGPLEWGLSARQSIALTDPQSEPGLAALGTPTSKLARLVAITLANKQAQIARHEQSAQPAAQPQRLHETVAA